MRLLVLTTLTMIAFAANSVLNRLALADGAIGPSAFAALRLGSGAVALAALVALRGRRLPLAESGRWAAVAALAVYVLGFSYAYLSLDAGIGALILFGAVQITMFAGAVLAREPVPPRRWAGAALAFAGLAWLFWPGGHDAPAPLGAALMAAAGVGWGLYSLRGRGASDSLAATAANFALAVPLGLAALLLVPDGAPLTAPGIGLALTSGVVTSGLGYALWYRVLPELPATIAAVAQLTVPLIAMAGGALFLGETLTLRFTGAALLVLGGIGLSLLRLNRSGSR
ncbi:DMT family transporter [Acidimangrovimonas pyrenivorans]|uniref:DMT family transporter n=1 Tax=Acidimangrovimonas pyrenivorans TaxID=2030798 RepID=A0ABV7AM74_9RHOB